MNLSTVQLVLWECLSIIVQPYTSQAVFNYSLSPYPAPFVKVSWQEPPFTVHSLRVWRLHCNTVSPSHNTYSLSTRANGILGSFQGSYAYKRNVNMFFILPRTGHEGQEG